VSVHAGQRRWYVSRWTQTGLPNKLAKLKKKENIKPQTETENWAISLAIVERFQLLPELQPPVTSGASFVALQCKKHLQQRFHWSSIAQTVHIVSAASEGGTQREGSSTTPGGFTFTDTEHKEASPQWESSLIIPSCLFNQFYLKLRFAYPPDAWFKSPITTSHLSCIPAGVCLNVLWFRWFCVTIHEVGHVIEQLVEKAAAVVKWH